MRQKQLKCFKCKEVFDEVHVGSASAFVCNNCEFVVHELRGDTRHGMYQRDLKKLDTAIDSSFLGPRSYYKHKGRYIGGHLSLSTAAQKLQAIKNKVQAGNVRLHSGIYQGQGFTALPVSGPSIPKLRPGYCARTQSKKLKTTKTKKVKSRKKVVKRKAKVPKL